MHDRNAGAPPGVALQALNHVLALRGGRGGLEPNRPAAHPPTKPLYRPNPSPSAATSRNRASATAAPAKSSAAPPQAARHRQTPAPPPLTSRTCSLWRSLMNPIMACVGGRAPPARQANAFVLREGPGPNRLTPCAGSRWLAGGPDSLVPVPSAGPPSPFSRQAPDAVALGLLEPFVERLPRAAALGSNRDHRRPARRRLELVIQPPPEPRGHGPHAKTCSSSSLLSLHLLRSWSRRQTRSGSYRFFISSFLDCLNRCGERWSTCCTFHDSRGALPRQDIRGPDCATSREVARTASTCPVCTSGSTLFRLLMNGASGLDMSVDQNSVRLGREYRMATRPPEPTRASGPAGPAANRPPGSR